MNITCPKCFLFIFLLQFVFVYLSIAQDGQWSINKGRSAVNYKISQPENPNLDFDNNYVTIVYFEGLGLNKLTKGKRDREINNFLDQGYRVVELDYSLDSIQSLISTSVNSEIIAVNNAVAKGEFCGLSDCSKNRTFVLFEGYRLKENVPYFIDDPFVYNTPKEYVVGDTLFMDIIYPKYSKHKVPVILSFSYSNSYATYDSDKKRLTDRNKHQRINLGYTFAGFNDSFLEGAPMKGMAWAIADHPKYCSWGKGKRQNGSNDEYKSFETNPDTGQKVKSAIRTLRAMRKSLNLSGNIGVYGFSRGSTAGAMTIGDRKDSTLMNAGFNQGVDDEIQAAILGPGVFDYTLIYDKADDGDRNMELRCPLVWGKMKDNFEHWQKMGASYLVETPATAPVLFFYNTTDEIYYQDQVKHLRAKLDSLGVPNSAIVDYGKGHSVPTDVDHLEIMYQFFEKYLKKD